MDPNKKYGLFKFSKTTTTTTQPTKPCVLKKASIFAEDSDNDDDGGGTSSIIPDYVGNSYLKKQTKNKIQEAMELDPTIFQYDEVYDQIKNSKQQQIDNMSKASVENNKPKYIKDLLKAAETRKKEQEIRFERKIQKEREKEGDEFKDKESFVTSSYREKLEEMRKTHEEMERQESIDSMLDVTKQNDLGGFYRSLYKNTLFKQKTNEEPEKIEFKKSSISKKITIRERANEDVPDEPESEEPIEVPKEKEFDKTEEVFKVPTIQINKPEEAKSNEKPKEEPESKDEPQQIQEAEDQNVPKEPKLTRSEIIYKLFTKRTIGEVFEEARKRYLERRKAKGQSI